METHYLVEIIEGSEYNIYSGTEDECYAEMKRIKDTMGEKANPMYVSINRWN